MPRKISKKPTENRISKIYYDMNNPAAYGGVKKLQDVVQLKKTKEWLATQPPYSLHKPIRKRYPTRKYYAFGLNHLWQMDLMEMIPYSSINKGYKYILTCVDVFSRFARAEPIKTKSGADVAKAIEKMIESNIPIHIQTDQGKEFYNTIVQNLLKKHKINHYSVFSQFKAAICERFNRTLREKLSRYFTKVGHKIWYEILPTIIVTYNKTANRGIFGLKPVEITKKNASDVWWNQEPEPSIPLVKYKLGNYVRISRIKGPFIKNFDQNWSEEVFQIVGIDKSKSPVMYMLEDLKHNVINGRFYTQELQVIGDRPPEVYRVEKIIKTKGRGEHKQFLVKWHGYSKDYNSWISSFEK